MAYPIDKKLVVAVASSALFDLAESDRIFRDKGEDEYRKHQRDNQKNVLDKGIAFPFIRRFLNLNKGYPEKQPVEVVLLSKNDPDTGLRLFHSISHYGLEITRGAFLNGRSPYEYIPAYNVSLFLSANANDVKSAISKGYPAGIVLPTKFIDNEADNELRIAFDFDGVIIDDQPETIYKKNGLASFHKTESENIDIPHDPGVLSNLFKKLAYFQKLEHKKSSEDPNYKRFLRTAIITARNAPAHERVVTTLRKWDVTVDEMFFLGGIDKLRILEVFKPHIFFDDQMQHLESAAEQIPSVHIPFGIANKEE